MQTFAHEALAGGHGPALAAIIVLSALGALAMCLLVLRFGFSSGDETPEQARGRAMVTRFVHAFAAVCFAACAMLAVVVLARRPAPPAPTRDPEVARVAEHVRAVQA